MALNIRRVHFRLCRQHPCPHDNLTHHDANGAGKERTGIEAMIVTGVTPLGVVAVEEAIATEDAEETAGPEVL